MIIQVAWRNVWRNRNRSLVVIVATIVAVVAVLFLMAFQWGMADYRIREAIEKETSHIQIHNPKFKEAFEAKYTIREARAISDKIKNDNRIAGASRRLIVTGVAQSSRATQGVMINGVDSLEEKITTGLNTDIVEGEYFGKTRSIPAVVGKDLVEDLQLELKKKVILQFQDAHGKIRPLNVKIMGIYETNNSRYDALNLFMPIDDLRRVLDLPEGYNEIAIRLKNDDDLDAVRADYDMGNGNLVETWKNLSPELALAIDTFDKSMLIIVFIFFLAVALVIINIMLMAVLERVREIGMLMAVGMNKTRIFLMFLLETVFLAVVGLPIGVLLGYALIETTGKSGIDLSADLADGYSEMGFSSVIYPALETDQYWTLVIEIMIIVFLAAIVPARRALKLNPATAIRKI